jgi:hypothetical protein
VPGKALTFYIYGKVVSWCDFGGRSAEEVNIAC